MADQAQQMAAAAADGRAAADGGAAAGRRSSSRPLRPGPDFEPIAGVSLELFAEVSKGLAAYGYDQSKAVEIAASKGVSAENWQQALDGWNVRVKANPAVAQRFSAAYQAS